MLEGLLTQGKDGRKNFLPNPTKHDVTSIVNTVNFRMAQLEAADGVIGLKHW